MNAPIRDVAQQAGVGLETVSWVLNNNPLESAATRQRMLDVIAKLCYSPSTVVWRLSPGKTLTIATIVPFFTWPSVIKPLRGIEATLTDISTIKRTTWLTNCWPWIYCRPLFLLLAILRPWMCQKLYVTRACVCRKIYRCQAMTILKSPHIWD